MLHIVSKSPFADSALDGCLSRWRDGDALILIEDAVIAALAGGLFASRLAELPIYVLIPDLEARGLTVKALVTGVTRVDYEGFVDLCAAQPASLSWL
ncbi:MAG TPA: sulfurtransferase complex subunit TusB [Candidatus Sulfotelmatobacter sp.]|jgi:tRNA 2-thiouridine synthesizing protein B|nr:sulfurtransferase complex subunit TusB [Candidatus Sulfotelmatobacter sp.]